MFLMYSARTVSHPLLVLGTVRAERPYQIEPRRCNSTIVVQRVQIYLRILSTILLVRSLLERTTIPARANFGDYCTNPYTHNEMIFLLLQD